LKKVSAMTLALLLMGMLVLVFHIQPAKADPATIYVDTNNKDGPWYGTEEYPYQNITSGLAHASDGDTIFVKQGNYTENIVVDKRVSLVGEILTNTTIYGMESKDDTVKITASGCVLENFTITNGGQPIYGGVRLNSSNSIVRYNNICNNRDDGIFIHGFNNTVANNTISNNKGSNIVLGSGSSGNIIANNTISDSTGGDGIYSCGSDNIIKNNIIKNNWWTSKAWGIFFISSSFNNTVTNNVIEGNSAGGIYLSSNGNKIITNKISLNDAMLINGELYGGHGIYFASSNNNTVTSNVISENEGNGARLEGSSGNIIADNTISLHTEKTGYGGVGIEVINSNGNFVHHNRFVNNTQQANSTNSVNVWDDGYPSGGNYWSDYNGSDFYSGPYQNVTGSDLIGDTLYNIDANNTDCYPLITEVIDAAVANVTTNTPVVVKGGTVVIKVTVKNEGTSSVNFTVATYYNGTFIDEEGIVDLGVGANETLTFFWGTGNVDFGYYVISANTSIVPGEFDKDDNTFIDGTVLVRRAGSGCPYVSAWNGSAFVLDNNLLLMSQDGADVTDCYMLQQSLAQRQDETYLLMLSEFESEHSYFDQVQLLAVDHYANVSVAVSPKGEVLTYTSPQPPVSAIDNNNRNVNSLLSSIDGSYYEGFNGSYITLNFGELDVSDGAKLVLRADASKYSIHIQVRDGNGRWNTVATVVPRVYWSTEIVDLSDYLPDAKGSLKVRLYFTANHKVDFVGLDTSPQVIINTQQGQLISAVHSVNGDVTDLLLYSDAVYAELVPRQNIQLAFTLPQQISEARTYIILAEGRYYTIQP